MRKDSITKRAFKLYSSYNPKYFPVKFFQILFDNFAPYFTLWMSSEIVTALYSKADKQSVYILIAITLLGNLLVRIISAVLKRAVDTQLQILGINECVAFNTKTLSLDYDKLENPEVRQHRRRITENSYINYYGVKHMRMDVEQLMTSVVNIGFSLVLFFEMLSALATVGLTTTSILLIIGLILVIAANISSRLFSSKKMSVASKLVGDQMLEENRMGRGYNTSGMDSRIYKQHPFITRFYQRIYKQHIKAFSSLRNTQMILSIPTTVTQVISEMCSYLIVCLYCILGAFPVGSVIKYVGYLGMLTANFGLLLGAINGFEVNEQYLKVYLDYFDIKNDMYQGSLSVEKRSDKKFDIEFRDVSFKYQGADDYALKHINLGLNVGERLAVVGMNGSGKTTFIKLLCRLYDPTEGEIFMNDFNVRKYDYRQYLDLFSVVFQDYKLLAVPLGNNVASSDRWDTAKVERLLDEVGFGDRYSKMPKKLDTPLYKDFDEDGVNVSGGEAQKIALARALYKDAPFIILDEPTAALDPIAEAEIYSKFDEIVGDKTAIYISHRLSSCRFCDKIAVFDQGEIVQVGTHEELLADTTGKYYELWHAQAQYYTEKTA